MNRKAESQHKKVSRTLSGFLGRVVDIGKSPGDPDNMPPKAARVVGPYYDANVNAYRVVVVEGDRRKSVRVATEAEALSLKEEIQRALALKTSIKVGAALDLFMAEKKQQGLKPRSLETLDYKLRYFLPLEDDLDSLTPERAAKLYLDETQRPSRYGRPVAAQTHHSILRMSKLFGRWAVERGHLRANPFEKVKAVGKANAGKPQLRIDEARRLFQVLLDESQTGDEGAIASLCQLLLGLRSSEVLLREVRDLDDSGRILWIPTGKTKNARHRLDVPEVLRPLLLRLVKGAPPERRIFGADRDRPLFHMWLWHQVKKFCQRAGLPSVCPHSLRGLHSSLAIAAGSTPGVVASALGHGSFAVTAKHYVDPDTLKNSTVHRVGVALGAEPAEPARQPQDPLERLRSLPPEKLDALLRLLDGAKAQ
jgi:integrase